MATKKDALINDALSQLKSAKAKMTAAFTSMTAGIWEQIIAILIPLALQLFQNCQKGPQSKKAAQIDDEMRRLSQIDRGTRQGRKLHKQFEKLFKKKEVIEANGGEPLTEEQKDDLYAELVNYAFVNRDAVAKAAASR